MPEVWLQSNRRAIWFGALLPACAALAGGAIALGTASTWLRGIGLAVALLGLLGALAILSQLRRPRIAYVDRELLLYIRSGPPIRLPAEHVEAFFLGQGPANIPTSLAANERTVNLVARISQRQTDWARHDVKSPIANWEDGYITFRGAWCEPLNHELIRRLNRRLKEVQTSSREKTTHVEK